MLTITMFELNVHKKCNRAFQRNSDKHSFISTAVVKAFIVYYFGDVIQSYVYTYSFYIDKTVMERGKWY